MTIIDDEHEIDLARRALATHPEFDLRSLFDWIDQYRNGYLTSSDIGRYLREKGLGLTERELFELCYLYERSADGRIHFPAFSRRVYGSDASRLYQIRNAPSREVEDLFLTYFQREIAAYRDLEFARRVVIDSHDFSLLAGFQVLNVSRYGHITRDQLLVYMQKHGYYLRPADLDRFWARFDRDTDGVISYTEFVELVLPSESTGHRILSGSSPFSPSKNMRMSTPSNSTRYHVMVSSPLRSSSPLRPSSPLRHENLTDRPSLSRLSSGYRQARRTSPLRDSSPGQRSIPSRDTSSPRRSSPLRNRGSPSPNSGSYVVHHESPLRSARDRNDSPGRSVQSRDRIESPAKSVRWADSPNRTVMTRNELSPPRASSRKASRQSSRRKTKKPSVRQLQEEDVVRKLSYAPFQHEEGVELARALNEQALLDREFETYRADLALRKDFNIPGLFRHFDLRDHGYFTQRDMERVLNKFGIYPSLDQIRCLQARYDKDGNGRSRMETFHEIWMPKEKLYADLMARKVRGPAKKTVFSKETKELLTKAFRKAIDIECTVEHIRKRLLTRPNFDHHLLFSMLDENRKGKASVHDLRGFLREKGIIPTDKDLTALMERYDRDSDGRISFEDFRRELSVYA